NYFFSGADWTADTIWVLAGGDTSWSFNNRMVNLDDGGLYRVYARAKDRAGNKDPVPVMDSLVYDSSLPQSIVEIDLEFYNQESWNADSSITGTAADSISAVDSVLIAIEYLDGSQWFDGTGWSPFETWQNALGLETWYFPLLLENLSDSIGYRVHSRAIDLAGNLEAEVATDIFTYDNSSPNTGLVYDGNEADNDIDWTSEDEFVAAVWSDFNDIVSGISQYEYRIIDDSDNILKPWTSVGIDTFVIDSTLSLMTGMRYFVGVRATDEAENTSPEVLSDGVIIDTIPPVITYIYEGSSDNDKDYQY
ncbi:MAG: hypothetical protein QGG54_21165, partial [Gammaproteobacteria bacterium]|nr:hypothetical protein [Gammaproteobacteria bacterium]